MLNPGVLFFLLSGNAFLVALRAMGGTWNWEELGTPGQVIPGKTQECWAGSSCPAHPPQSSPWNLGWAGGTGDIHRWAGESQVAFLAL